MRAAMMRFIFCFLASTIAAVSAFAEDAVKMNPGDVLRGHFTQERMLSGFSSPLESAGSFVLSPKHGLIWHVEKPFDVSTVMTDRGIAQFNGDAEMMNLAAAQAPFVAQLYKVLGSALTGDFKALETYFTVEKKEDATGWSLLLTPRDAASAETLQLVSIAIDGGKFVERVEVTKVSGDIDRLTFSDQIVGGEIGAAESILFDRVGKK